MIRSLFITFVTACYCFNLNAQAPQISYSSPQAFITGQAIIPLIPTNTGGVVPAKVYGEVSTFAGSGSIGSTNGIGTSASFHTPNSVAVDAVGNVYVSDEYNYKIRKITTTGVVTTFAGNGSASSVDGIATSAGFYNPTGIAVDALGNVYVADYNNNKIRKISATGVVSTLAGNGSYSFADGPGATASFKRPSGLTLDSIGNVYVADQGNNLIRKISPLGIVTTFAGTGSAGSANGIGTAASFYSPSGLAIDRAGNVYVADKNNNLIRKITPAGVVSTFAGNGSQGSVDGQRLLARFDVPMSVAVDAIGNIYVADAASNKIRLINTAGLVSTLAGNNLADKINGIGTAASFRYPSGLALDGKGMLYVADQNNDLIRKVTVLGYSISPALPLGLRFDSTNGTISGTPMSISGSTLYTITANNVNGSSTTTLSIATVIPAVSPIITSFSPVSAPSGKAITIRGSNLLGAGGVSIGGVPAASYSVISSDVIIAVVPANAASGNITVTNQYGSGNIAGFTYIPAPKISYDSPQNYTIGLSINPLTPANSGSAVPATIYAQVTTVAGSGSRGALNGPSTTASFNTPSSTVIDAFGNMFISDILNHQIRKITPDGTVSTFAGNSLSGRADGLGTAASFTSLSGMTIDPSGNLYVIANNAICKITPAGLVSTFAGDRKNVFNFGFADGPATTALFNAPKGLAIDVHGYLYVSDNNRIRKISPAGDVSTLAGNGSSSIFSIPAGIALDGSGNIYVADSFNNRIRKVTPSGSVTTIAGSGGSGDINGIGTSARFNYPQSVAVDVAGNVYVADENNYKIKMINPAGVVSTIAGNDTPGALNGVGALASFNGVTGFTFDSAANLYFADQKNNLIRKIALTGYKISPPLPEGLIFDVTTGIISGTPTVLSATTNYTITASNAQGISNTNLSLASVIPAVAPSVTSFSRSSFGYDKTILITGTNLLGATAVNIGGVPAVSFVAVSSTSITAVVPVGAISGNITVTNIHGTGAINGFTATPPPNISYNSPGVYTVGSAITPLAPINTGSQIPVKTYGEVTAFAGNGLSGSENGILTSSSFKFPYATALDAQGNMYVADAGNNLIRKITKDGVVSTFAGSGLASFADGSGTSAGFNNPWGLAVDLAGNVYVADAGNNRVRKISTAGVVTTIAGSGISGSFNGIGTAASFSKPQGVALDRYGNILVADGLSNKIRKITPAGQVSTFAGNGSQGSVNGYTSTASFYNPTGIVVDTSGIVYITDQNNHKIRIVLPNSPENIVLNMAGTGISGSANGTGISASFASPTGITLDNYGNILVADAANNTIRKITSTNVVSTLAGSGLVSAVNGIGIGASFSRPTGITSDGQGTLYVADQNNHQIRKINL